MPFKSEKQRRFLWAEHPDIAKRWAHEYPNQKNLPTYAHKKKPTSTDTPSEKSKESSINISKLVNRYVNNRSINSVNSVQDIIRKTDKTADSKQERVDIPHSSEPVYAGEEREKGKITSDIPGAMNISETDNGDVKKPQNAINELLTKLSVVLSPHIEQTIENMRAEREGRVAVRIPRNRGIKRYPCATPSIPLPMGMAQAQQPQPQTQQQRHQPVGGGSNPQFNPINAFGAISATGVINGNAAFGAKNSPDSSKLSCWLRAKLAENPVTPANTGPAIPDWIDAKYHEGLQGAPGGRKYMYFPHADNLPEAGGKVIETETGSIVQSNIPDRKAYFKYLQDGGNADPKPMTFGAPQAQAQPQQAPATPTAPPAKPAAPGSSSAPTPTAPQPQGGAGYMGTDALNEAEYRAMQIGQADIRKTRAAEQSAKPTPTPAATPAPTPAPAPAVKPPVPAPNTGAMTAQPIPVKQASRSEILGKIMSIDANDEDMAYWEEEYCDELAGYNKKAAKDNKTNAKTTPCSCGCGDTISTCKCPQSCSCKQPGGSCYKPKEKDADMVKYSLEDMLKIARCWAGYEPVPGKAPYSEDSCRPVGSGKKKKKENKKSEKKANKHWTVYDAEMQAQKGTRSGDLWRKIINTPQEIGSSMDDLVAKHKKLLAEKDEQRKEKSASTPAWQRSEGKNEEGGLNEKGRKSYEREHGGNLKAPVTQKNPKGEAKKRQNSFCSRMCGMKRVNTGASTAKDPDSRINKSLRKWNCKCSSAELFGQKLAEMSAPGMPAMPAKPAQQPQQPRLMSQIVGQLVDKVVPVDRAVTSPSRGQLLAQKPVQPRQVATAN